MSHQDDIKAIVTSVGGAANIKSLTHCATRLRFELNDAGKVDNAALDANKLVLGAVPQSGDRYQVVIGGQVASVYEQIMHLPEMAGLGRLLRRSGPPLVPRLAARSHGSIASSNTWPTPSARFWVCCLARPSSSHWSTCAFPWA